MPPSARCLLATLPPLVMVWKPPVPHAGSREGECARVHFTSPSASREVRFVGHTHMTSRQRRQRRHKHASLDGLPLISWMVCKQPRVKKELEKRGGAALPRDANRERDMRKVQRYCLVGRRQRRPFAPRVTCWQTVTCVAGKF